MDINLVNYYWPNTIRKLALNASDFPNGETSIPFLGVFVQLQDGGVLPSEADVTAKESDYAVYITATQSNQIIKQQITALEATQTPRRVREGGQWMIDLNMQIAALRAQLK